MHISRIFFFVVLLFRIRLDWICTDNFSLFLFRIFFQISVDLPLSVRKGVFVIKTCKIETGSFICNMLVKSKTASLIEFNDTLSHIHKDNKTKGQRDVNRLKRVHRIGLIMRACCLLLFHNPCHCTQSISNRCQITHNTILLYFKLTE